MILKYRKDIDGLRAVAVLSVVLYHLNLGIVSGGYVGVDIFFVISGYLITAIIYREVKNGTFSFTQFYERRFRRILPALIAVVFASLIFGTIILNPQHLIDLSQSVVANSLFSSNLLFYVEADYFGGPIDFKPLLHTWSLSVEEQFYIFMPIFLLLINRYSRQRFSQWLIFVALFSLALSIIGMSYDKSATFYLLPTRAWELLIGSLLAIKLFPALESNTWRNIAASAGFLAIIISVFFYSDSTDFPGFSALLPTIGTALIIYAGTGGTSLVNKIISFPPIVFIGLISYSLYLWHWPIIIYIKYLAIDELDSIQKLWMLAGILIISILSYYFIETPFRKKTILVSRKSLFGGLSVVSVVLIAFGLFTINGQGYPERADGIFSAEELNGDPEWLIWHNCNNPISRLEKSEGLCKIGDKNAPVNFILWGDSHATALAPSVNLAATKSGLQGAIATQNACPPLLGIERPNQDSCYEFNQKIFDYIENNNEIESVILVARWALSAKGTRYKNEAGAAVQLIDRLDDTHSLSSEQLFNIGVNRTITSLLNIGKKVILVGPIPEVAYDVPAANYSSHLMGRNVNVEFGTTLQNYIARTEDVHAIFSSLAGNDNIHIVDPALYLCDEERCNITHEGISLYRDNNHLSTYGSKLIAPMFDKAWFGNQAEQ